MLNSKSPLLETVGSGGVPTGLVIVALKVSPVVPIALLDILLAFVSPEKLRYSIWLKPNVLKRTKFKMIKYFFKTKIV